MSELRTDEETVEQIQRWWRENGTTLVVTVVVVLAGVFGWNWWQAQTQAETAAASALYLNWLEQQERGDEEAAAAIASSLREAHPESAYVALLRFDAAATAVADGDSARAMSELEAVLAMDLSAAFRDLARLRMARLELDAGRATEALARLDAIAANDAISAVQELRGDALRELGRTDDARAAYEAAMRGSEASRPLLEMKRDALAAAGGPE